MKYLGLLLALLLLSQNTTQAEVYKWREKDGTIKYSDTPPPANVKQEPMIGNMKVLVPSSAPAPASTLAAAKKADTPPTNPEDAAKKRQQEAEIEKQKKLDQEAEAKRKAENCTGAKANMETYKQGGRVYKINEKGEREYLDETGFKEGREKAQQAINENC